MPEKKHQKLQLMINGQSFKFGFQSEPIIAPSGDYLVFLLPDRVIRLPITALNIS